MKNKPNPIIFRKWEGKNSPPFSFSILFFMGQIWFRKHFVSVSYVVLEYLLTAVCRVMGAIASFQKGQEVEMQSFPEWAKCL